LYSNILFVALGRKIYLILLEFHNTFFSSREIVRASTGTCLQK